MLQWLSKLVGFGGQSSQQRHVRARYDAAQTTVENSNHWAYADSLSANAANSPGVRQKLRNRARYEFANSPYLHGMIRTLANRTIGTGPTLQVKTGNPELDAKIERGWAKWAKSAKLAKKIHTLFIADCRDGEGFGLLTTNPAIPGPVKLDLHVVEADQVYSPGFAQETATHCDGIDYDAHGNPTFYYLAKQHPGDAAVMGLPGDYQKVSADFVIHLFREDRPGQRRGIPRITPALPMFAIHRRYTQATLIAAETAANIAAYLKTPTMPPQETGEPEQPPFTAIDIQRGTMMTLPEGWDISQLKAEHPTSTYDMFSKALIREEGRCLEMPFNVAACDSSSYNYASGRLDGQNFDLAIDVDRSVIATHLDRILQAYLDEAALAGEVPQIESLEHEWRWPAGKAIDPQTEATANKIALGSGTQTLPAHYAQQGLDWATEMAKGAESLGLTIEEYQKILAQSLFTNGNPLPSDQQQAQQQEAANEQPAAA